MSSVKIKNTRNSPTGLEGPKGWGFRKRMLSMDANLRDLRVDYHHAALAHDIGAVAVNMGAGSASPFLRMAPAGRGGPRANSMARLVPGSAR